MVKHTHQHFLIYRLDLGSAIHTEHIDIFHKDSRNALADFWMKEGPNQDINQIMELDEYCGRIPPQVFTTSRGAIKKTMKIYDHIGVWEGLVTKEFCQRVIDSFEHFYALKYVKKDISEGLEQGSTNEGKINLKMEAWEEKIINYIWRFVMLGQCKLIKLLVLHLRSMLKSTQVF